MIYLYSYYAITAVYVVALLATAYKAGSWQARVTLGSTALFVGATATMLGLLHSWTGDGFGYFAAILRAMGVQI